MSNYIVTDTELTSIANAVRTKSGGNSSLQFPTGFVSEIQSISAGATEVEEKDVNFIDYDGTILYSYTVQEAQALEALPANPTHEGLTAQGWNWTLAQIKTQLTQVGGKVWVGQMYITSSGDTEIYITLDDSEYLSPYLTLVLNGEASIDWGDNTLAEIITGSNLVDQCFYQHTYTQKGNYVIKITVNNGKCGFHNTAHDYDGILNIINQTSSNKNRGHIYNAAIKHIRIGNNMYIGTHAFTQCISLQTITIPSFIESMEGSIFNACGLLQSVTIPSLVTKFGNYTFRGCCKLQNISLPPSITTMGSSVFSSCYSLQTLTIPFSVTKIGDQTFTQCYSLYSINIPPSVTTLRTGLFTSCNILQDIKILASSVTVEASAFNTCTSLRNITLPPLSTTTISDQTFSNCYSLIRITIPATITELGKSAFYYCYALHNITIPSSVDSIGNQAFAYCYSMESYHFQSTTPPSLSATNVFNGIDSGCIIYVPYSADHSVLNAYGTATNWSTYATYLKEEGENGITWAEWQALNA